MKTLRYLDINTLLVSEDNIRELSLEELTCRCNATEGRDMPFLRQGKFSMTYKR